jgi:hypothetical protein
LTPDGQVSIEGPPSRSASGAKVTEDAKWEGKFVTLDFTHKPGRAVNKKPSRPDVFKFVAPV